MSFDYRPCAVCARDDVSHLGMTRVTTCGDYRPRRAPLRLTPVKEIDAEGRDYIERTYLTDEDD